MVGRATVGLAAEEVTRLEKHPASVTIVEEMPVEEFARRYPKHATDEDEFPGSSPDPVPPFGRSVMDFLKKTHPMTTTDWPTDEPEPEPDVPSWSEFYAKCRAAGDDGANIMAEEMAIYNIRKFPPGFLGWPEKKQVAWLDEKHQRRA
jgi:hypothetical protein